MRVRWMPPALLGLGLVAGCGSTAPVDFFDSSAGGGGASAGAGAPAGAGAGAAGAMNLAGGTFMSSAAGSVAGGADAAIGGASASVAGSAGATASIAGGAGAGVGGSVEVPNDQPCSPTIDVSTQMSGPFGSADRVCIRVTDDVAGWTCSSFEGRHVKVNGVDLNCGQVPLPEKVDGAYYFDISPGKFAYASVAWWS